MQPYRLLAKTLGLCCLFLGLAAPVWAQTPAAQAGAKPKVAAPQPAPVQISGAWARATVPGQKVAVAYMQLQAQEPGLVLQSLDTPVAEQVQLHDMQMQGDVMRMRELPHLDLPLGIPVVLAPSGKHIMLMGLGQVLRPGDQLALTLHFNQGRSLQLSLPVLNTAPNSSQHSHAMH